MTAAAVFHAAPRIVPPGFPNADCQSQRFALCSAIMISKRKPAKHSVDLNRLEESRDEVSATKISLKLIMAVGIITIAIIGVFSYSALVRKAMHYCPKLEYMPTN